MDEKPKKKKIPPKPKGGPKKKQPSKRKPRGTKAHDGDRPIMSIADAFQVLQQQDPEYIRGRQNIDALNGTIKEFMSNYILIGHDISGRCVQLTCATTPKDNDALNAAFQRYIFDMYKGPSSGYFE